MKIKTITSLTPSLPYIHHCVSFSQELYRESDFNDYCIHLSDEVKKSAVKRRAEYLAGRVCAQRVLNKLNYPNFVVKNGMDRAPIWPAGIVGTITHCSDIAMAMAYKDHNILGLGIDIENNMSEKQEHSLLPQIISSYEMSAFLGLSKYLSNPLTLVFSAKESIYKALYNQVRRIFSFEAVELITYDDKILRFRVVFDLSNNVKAGTILTVFYKTFTLSVLTECVYKVTDQF